MRFDDGSGFDLTEAGTRKRLAVHVVRHPEEVRAIETLGVEPLDPAFTPEALGALMAARNQQVKGLLRDQSSIAGIGNAYSDDILHAARTSPFKLTRSFTPDEVARVHAAVGEVLAEAVAAASGKPAAELKDAKRAGMRVHGRTGLPCPVCGDTVREVSFADRSLQYCPTCQTGGQVLADRRMSRLLK
ncbi:DNA-formamidopyrimidine glycosylase [Mycobacteroides abscessus]|nr:DNA-formamidopyrimidine glycosylase [Mycobacteroides abscessus]